MFPRRNLSQLGNTLHGNSIGTQRKTKMALIWDWGFCGKYSGEMVTEPPRVEEKEQMARYL